GDPPACLLGSFFFFQAEDGIRGFHVTGVQTCALPIFHLFEAGPPLQENFLRRMILPWIALAFLMVAGYARLTRGAMLDVLGEDYVRTARAKGLRERRVLGRHVLRPAMAPVVTQFGIDLGAL